jgi:MFS transporter, DHA1 family, tetracycline resistance protein
MTSIRIVLLGLFGAYVGFAMLNPILAPLIRTLGLSELQAGSINSVAALAWFLTSPHWGRRSDRIGRKPVFITGLIGFGVGLGVFGFVAQLGVNGALGGAALFALLFIGRIVAGAFFSASPAAAQAYVADVTTPDQRTGAMALIGAATGMGLVIGPALAGVLVPWGLLVPLYVGAALPIVAALIVLWRLPQPARQAQTARPLRLRLFDGRLWPFVLVGLIANMTLIMAQLTVGFLLQDRLQLAPEAAAQTLGGALVAAGVTLVAVQVLIVRRFKLQPRTLMRWGMPLCCVAFVLLLLTGNVPLLIVAFVLLAAGLGLNEPGFTSAMTLAVQPHEYGAVSGVTAAVIGLASMVGPVLGTALYTLDPQAPYAGGALLLLAMIVFVWRNGQIRQAVPAHAAQLAPAPLES